MGFGLWSLVAPRFARRDRKSHEVPVIVRPATQGDGARCAEIYLVARRLAFSWHDAETFALEDFHRAIEDQEVWVADRHGVVVGFVSFHRPENLIDNLFIDPPWQRQGLGSRLLETAHTMLGDPARLHCLIANRPARAFYERNGWVAERSNRDGTDPYIVFRK
ncbi:MAG: GNAT family N-acetyltransferase [Azospirillaceae bacterium]|nr:GNAT family N-acetyltransferase [Azospirillaceae bacterium]